MPPEPLPHRSQAAGRRGAARRCQGQRDRNSRGIDLHTSSYPPIQSAAGKLLSSTNWSKSQSFFSPELRAVNAAVIVWRLFIRRFWRGDINNNISNGNHLRCKRWRDTQVQGSSLTALGIQSKSPASELEPLQLSGRNSQEAHLNFVVGCQFPGSGEWVSWLAWTITTCVALVSAGAFRLTVLYLKNNK